MEDEPEDEGEADFNKEYVEDEGDEAIDSQEEEDEVDEEEGSYDEEDYSEEDVGDADGNIVDENVKIHHQSNVQATEEPVAQKASTPGVTFAAPDDKSKMHKQVSDPIVEPEYEKDADEEEDGEEEEEADEDDEDEYDEEDDDDEDLEPDSDADEELSDVDDSDLMKRLESKYGKLPEGDDSDEEHPVVVETSSRQAARK